MRATRYSHSWPVICTILIVLLLSAEHAATAPKPTPNATSLAKHLIRRVDKPPREGPGEEGHPPPDYNYDAYVQQGALFALYLRSSDAQVTEDLVSKGKLQAGQQLASPFIDVSAFRSSGWEELDRTSRLAHDFTDYVPFHAAFRSLGISDQGRPNGKNELTVYQHTLEWQQGHRLMEPVGSGASFSFVTNPQDACLVLSEAYSTQYKIKEKGLDKLNIVSPPLSHASDMAFLDWKRACTKYHTEIKSLKHIFLSVIVTDTTQEVVDDIYWRQGKELTSWEDIPLWEHRMVVRPESDEGKALLGTDQLKIVMWMLVQHREHLGRKTIKQMSVFKDELTGISDEYDASYRGPSIYLELEDVQG